MEQWLRDAAKILKDAMGLDSDFAMAAAKLYLYLWYYGLNPRITSGFRDPKKQAAMRAAWDAGQRSGLKVRPADPANSDHCRTGFFGKPASTAIDIDTNNYQFAGQIADSLGIGWGGNFSTPDPVHFYLKKVLKNNDV